MTNKDKKILIINYEFPPLGGGGGVAAYDLALEWLKYGQVDVLTSGFEDLPSYENMKGINIYRSKIFFRKSRDAATFISMLSFLITGFLKGFSLMRKNRYTVINTHFAVPSGPLGYVLGKFFSVPNVLSLHGGDIYDPSKKMSPHNSFFFKRVVAFILNRAQSVVAQSSNTRDNAVKYYNPGNEVLIIPLAFHQPEILPATRKDFNLDNNTFYLITIGRLVKRKSIETIIYALSGIENKNIKLLILGDGPEKEFLSDLAVEKKVEDKIIFCGYVSDEDKYKYLSLSDVFILTSLHEGFGIVFMEAMYCSLPIICTNHGGQTDFLEDRQNALLLDVGDVESCKNSIIELSGNKNLYRTLSINNKEKVKDFYAESVAMRYLEIFKELSEQKKNEIKYRSGYKKP